MSSNQSSASAWVIGLFIFCGVAAGVVILGLLAYVVGEKRAETASVFNNKVVHISGIEPHNAKWGLNYPREYETWAKTANMDFKSKHMGSMPQDTLSERPVLAVFWAGYAFARDYKAPRGHFYAVDDVRNTLRTGHPGIDGGADLQPSTCWTCKSPDVPRMMAEVGTAEFYKSPWSSMGNQIVNPIGCADCHDPENMELAISRPGLKEVFQRAYKDVGDATRQEKRSLVCAQCHVEYYFQGDGKYLTLPWDDGTWGRGPAELAEVTVEQMEKYYDEAEYSDFVNAVSKTPILKAQHPDWELFRMGPHAKKGVSCADCHMPYVSEGGLKYSNHQLRSPLADISSTCGTCHRDSEEALRGFVYERQDKVIEIRERLEAELFRAHVMAKAAMEAGATDGQLLEARKLIRASQWRWDFVVASHGAPFHAPLESARVLGLGLDKAYQAQLALQDVLNSLGAPPVELPDISTLEKAQAWIGLDMPALRAAKEQFVETVVPQWLQQARDAGRI
ncbi:MAG: ammonia-forming cytochrome c nitrite reductase subunit c552 [Deltaproteobacteria bacterium]|jgi:nitrite reductase (cytochrome c-552)|nr:ammonia-forming cytochrome c nitrite reductase subunit c552 [Deltaproteobacteria bacterium]